MKASVVCRFLFSAFLCSSLIGACAQSYRDELNLGVAAYKNSHYEEATQHFRKAAELDPSQMAAHMYLATALVSQYIPGVETQDNLLLAQQAIEEYQLILDGDATREQKLNSAKGVAYLYLNTKNWDEAKQYYQQASDFDPADPEPYYSMGVIDWTRTYQPRMEARAKLKMAPERHLDSAIPAQQRICEELRATNAGAIDDGIDNLNKAIRLRPDYDDAMAYMNLMFRERADLECDDPAARDQDLKTADEWVDKALAVKKAKAQKQGSFQR